jgi:diguanylate cyclase (GGDEF)-like protein/putative nucleotidyltransferase with HDIG domain
VAVSRVEKPAPVHKRASLKSIPLISPWLTRENLVKAGLLLVALFLSFVLVLVWRFLLSPITTFAGAVVATGFLELLCLIALPWIRKWLERKVDRFYFGGANTPRAALHNFPAKIQHTLEIEKIAPNLLSLLSEYFQLQQSSLLLDCDGSYISRYSARNLKHGLAKPILMKKESVFLKRLAKENRPLKLGDQELNSPQSDLEKGERSDLKAAEADLVCPLSVQQRLVGILVLSKNTFLEDYSADDLRLIKWLCEESAPILENALLYERARERANSDELTGLFNRGFFHQRLEEEIARSSRYGEVFSLVMIDVDNFKQCNDAGGHQIGDEVLKGVCKFIQSAVRNSDVCFRYGGDEFTIILPQTTMDGGKAVSERVRKGIESLIDLPVAPLTVSIGVACWPTDGVMKDDLIRSADAALYYSKQTGKNRVNLACQVALSQVFRIESATDASDSDSKAQVQTIHTLAANVDNKDPFTSQHSLKVSAYASLIAEALGLSQEDVERIRTAGLLHDVGKIGIPEQILNKRGPLTSDEREIIQAHPNLGVSIIEHVEALRACLAGIQYHHEHFDGRGYPSGLQGNNVPLDARILAVADSFDAMTSPRPYRKIMTREEALQEIKTCSGTQFDPHVVEVFLSIKNLEVKASDLPQKVPSH